MEKEIRCAVDTLYHCLTHFEQIDEDIVDTLLQAGYSITQIKKQLEKPGSRFRASFGRSPMQVFDKLKSAYPEVFRNLPAPDSDGRIRLSFVLNEQVGTDGVVAADTLSPEELSTMHKEDRNGIEVKMVTMSRMVFTKECQLVLAIDDDCCHIITLYPGIKAPPLPKSGEADPFWDSHCFVEYQ